MTVNRGNEKTFKRKSLTQKAKVYDIIFNAKGR